MAKLRLFEQFAAEPDGKVAPEPVTATLDHASAHGSVTRSVSTVGKAM